MSRRRRHLFALGKGNNFTSDARIIEFWKFENNLTAGKNGNDLTPAAGGVGYTNVNPIEGLYTLSLANGSNQYAKRTDANLSAGFPLKSTDAVKKFTICLWIKPTLANGFTYSVIAKHNLLANKACLDVQLYNSTAANTTLRIAWGRATAQETWNVATLLTGVKYHITIKGNGVAKTCSVRVYNDTDKSTTSYDHTFTNAMVVSDVDFVVGNNAGYGGGNAFNGLIDEVVIANDVLTDLETDHIRQGMFR